MVALAPGGPADTAARVFAPYFSEYLGHSVVIENRTGASSVVGTEAVVRAPPDGYTLLFGSSSSFAVNPAVMKNLRFDVQKDLKLVGLVSYTPHVLVMRASLPAGTLAELIALAKAQPGKLSYASSGVGGAIHLASELFKREAGVDIVHVPYRGGGPAVMGLLTGDVDIFINDASTTGENIQAGKLKALAVAWPKRSPLLPQVPTFAELGFPSVVSSSWFGLAAPRTRQPTSSADWPLRCPRSLPLQDIRRGSKSSGLSSSTSTPNSPLPLSRRSSTSGRRLRGRPVFKSNSCHGEAHCDFAPVASVFPQSW